MHWHYSSWNSKHVIGPSKTTKTIASWSIKPQNLRKGDWKWFLNAIIPVFMHSYVSVCFIWKDLRSVSCAWLYRSLKLDVGSPQMKFFYLSIYCQGDGLTDQNSTKPCCQPTPKTHLCRNEAPRKIFGMLLDFFYQIKT